MDRNNVRVETSPTEFERVINLLPDDLRESLYLIPIQRLSKNPDVEMGGSWKDPKHRLTVEQALERLERGLNVGIVATGEDLVIIDVDDPEQFRAPKPTLQVETRSGKTHLYYLNGGDVKNRDMPKVAEVRAEWRYVLAPGSYVPPEEGSRGTGLYRIQEERPLAILHAEDLPDKLKPESTPKIDFKELEGGTWRNQYGWALEDIRRRDGKLDTLLDTDVPPGYPSASEADMAALSKLIFWGYSESEAVDILRHFRGREKLGRRDYVERTLSKVGFGETIASYVDPHRWHPDTGYRLHIETEPIGFDRHGQHRVQLVFNVVSDRQIRVRAVKEGEAVTGWVSVDCPEKLRTSPNATILRKVLKDEHPADWRILLERTVERIQKAVANFREEAEQDHGEKEAEPEVDPEAEAEILGILESPNPLQRIKEHLDNLIAGEDSNKQTIFLLLLSGKCQDPALKQMILLKGEAGAGKTTLMCIADLFKTKSVGRFTEHALDYTELEGFEVLKLQEIGVMDEEKQGVSTLKFLSSEDEGYVVEFTVRDPETGEFTTSRKRIPAITVISGTTRVSLDPQYTRRNWIISPDESEEQTLRIAEWIARREREKAEVLLGVRGETSYEHSRRVLKELVERIEPCSVIVPFTDSLLSILDSTRLRVRGDYKKLLGLVKFHSILLQNQLSKVPATSSQALIASPEHALKALKVAQDPLTSMTAELDKRTERTLDILKDLGITGEGSAIDTDKRGQIAVMGGWSSETVRRYLNEIEERGYLSSDGKRPKTWFLLYDMATIRRKLSVISGKIENPDNLMGEMEKEAQKWLNSISGIKNQGGMGHTPGVCATHPPKEIPDNNSNKEQASFEETEPKHRDYQKFPIIPAPSSPRSPDNGVERKYVVSETVEHLRYLLPKRFIENDFVEHAVKLGLDEDVATRLFWRIVEEGRILRDPDGFWQWV